MFDRFHGCFGGPRPFFSHHGGNRIFIRNNFFGGIPFRPAPIFCCGSNGYFNNILQYSLITNLINNQFNPWNSFANGNNYYNNFNRYNNYNYSSIPQKENDTKIDNLSKRIDGIQKEIDELKKEIEKDKPINELKDNADLSHTKSDTQNSKKQDNNDNTTSSTNPNSNENKYINNHILNSYKDENGVQRYDIKAIVHDGDTAEAVKSRFFDNGEKEKAKIETAERQFHTQKSETRKINNPFSGEEVILKGVSEFGINALKEDAKNNINKQTEMQKTNQRLQKLKEEFLSGKNKLSKAYVIQNKLMSSEEYDNIIKSKYNN